MAVSQRSSKGNPAHKRMSNDNLKAKRKRCWERGKARKRARNAANEARYLVNLSK